MYGAYIKGARERAGLSVAQAAAAIHKGQDLIYRIERDAADPSMDTLERLATAYNCLPGDLLPNSGGDAALAEILQPLVASLAGLDQEEMREQILILASQARMNRNAILRRAPLAASAKAVAPAVSSIHPTISVLTHSSALKENAPHAKTDTLGYVADYPGEGESADPDNVHPPLGTGRGTGTILKKARRVR